MKYIYVLLYHIYIYINILHIAREIPPGTNYMKLQKIYNDDA